SLTHFIRFITHRHYTLWTLNMASSPRSALCLLAHLLLLFSSVLATPLTHNRTLSDDDALAEPWTDKPFYLRIMPLGASITAGVGTDPQNGYRKPLRDQLRWEGWPVNMVGSQSNGDPEKFKDRQHEGHPGAVVSDMIKNAGMGIDTKPNLILINCGTNDANPKTGQDVDGTAARMELLLNYLYEEVEGVTIILSTLIPYLENEANNNVNKINPTYRDLYKRFRDAGKKIGLAELNNGFLDTSTDYHDTMHPNEKGAAKLAAVWDQAIAEVEKAGFLTKPIDTGVDDDTTVDCDPEKGAGRGPVKTQQGWGEDDGPYKHFQTVRGYITESGAFNAGSRVSFAQLVNLGGADPGGEFDELINCVDKGTSDDPTPGTCRMYLNDGGNIAVTGVAIDVGLKCLIRGHHWGDVNGDGLDDFICINLDGNMYVSINRGGNPPKFEPLENGGLIKEGYAWGPQDRVRLGDIDGDGRLDYCAIDDKGDIYCWRNGGVGDAPTETYGGYWQSFETFAARGEAEGIGGVNLVDVNGDGRSDWVYLHKDGSSEIWINQRGDFDADGKGLRPHWVEATAAHPAIPELTDRTELVFGRISGSGRADLIWNRIADEKYVQSYAYTNKGSGGTQRKGDGVHYCDMFGRGHDDYLWVSAEGEITLFENIKSPPNWGQHGKIISIGRERKSIHFGDWDGDGLCDILAVERHTGRAEMWRNTYKDGAQSPTFSGPTWVVNDALCKEGWGRGLYDQGLRFGDLDGDGRVDYLCMEKDARTVGHLNKAGGLEDKGQIKFAPAERLDRANFKWADVNGDGKVDLIWVDKFKAGARVWRNGGFIPAGGSSMTWIDLGTRFEGHGRGQNIHFPTLGELGRADYHDVYPGTALANTWFNECSGGDDYPEPIDPGLPKPPVPSINVCDSDATWSITADSADTDIVDDQYTTGIKDVFGDTCNYVNVDGYTKYEDYDVGQLIGYLNCAKWDRVECVKTEHSLQLCFLGFGLSVYAQSLVKCSYY
ncbi:hypothetical protein N5P37_006451, partial [Trichoderma harzianum]